MNVLSDKQLIIIGGGTSIKEGIKKGLWESLKGKFTFGLNYSYNYFESTAQFYVDKQFYVAEYANTKDLPLIIGKFHKYGDKKAHENTILLRASSSYDPTLKTGVYKSSLCGIYTLSVSIFLCPREVFLLGFDYGTFGDVGLKDKKFQTHFYQGDIEHRGVGKVNYYSQKGRGDRDFGVFNGAPMKIYNVSMESKITSFPKISYDQFFEKLDNIDYDQDELRGIIKTKLKEVI